MDGLAEVYQSVRIASTIPGGVPGAVTRRKAGRARQWWPAGTGGMLSLTMVELSSDPQAKEPGEHRFGAAMCLVSAALVTTCFAQPATVGATPPATPAPPSAAPAFEIAGPPGYLVSGDDAPTDIPTQLLEDSRYRQAAVETPFLEGPLFRLRKESERLFEETGLKLGFAYTMLFQQASGGPGDRYGGGGDLDLLASWTALGRGTKDTGTLYFAAEYRNQIGSQTPSELGADIGSLTGTTNGFSERTMVVKELYWKQAMLDGRFVWGVGRVDPENLFGGHKLQSANLYFLNQAFSTNPTIPFPGSGLGAAAAFKPVDWFYVGAGIDNANGKTTTISVSEFFDEREYLTFAEGGFTPTIERLGNGRYRVSLWHIDDRELAGQPSDQGVSLIADQEIGKQTTVFARYGWADDGIRNVQSIAEGGVAINGLLGGDDDQTGLAGAWVQPTDSSLRDQYVLEAYQRFQITQQTQLTFDAELILNPSNAPDDDAVAVFSVRLRFAF